MKYSTYIVIILMALLTACTKAELCDDTEHPHRAGVQFAFDWANDTKGIMTDGLGDNDSVIVLSKRIIGTWVMACRVGAKDGNGYYLVNGPSSVPVANNDSAGADDTGSEGTDTDATGTDGTDTDDTGTDGTDTDDTGTDGSGADDTDTEGTGADDGSDTGSGDGADTDDGSGSDDGDDTPTDSPAAPDANPVPGYDTPTDLFKIQAGMFKMIAINCDTTEFDYSQLLNYVDNVESGTTLGDICVEYKRYSSKSDKLRGAIAGWTDYNIYGGDANYLQPDMIPVYYDTIAPVTISRGVQQQFQFRPVILTQNIDIRFHLRKKYNDGDDENNKNRFQIEGVYGGISGIPYRVNLSSGLIDTENTAKMMFTCDLQDENGNALTDSEDNEQPMVCHGNIDVLTLVNSPDPGRLRGPGILQLMIRIKNKKTIRVKVNLHNALERARLYEAVDDSNWARLRKRKGQLEIDADLVIDEDTVLPSEDGGMEVWIQAGKDDIVVDT